MMTGFRSMKNSGRTRQTKKGFCFQRQRIRHAARTVMAMIPSKQSLYRAVTRLNPRAAFALSKFFLNGIARRIIRELVVQNFRIYDFRRLPETRSGTPDSMFRTISQIFPIAVPAVRRNSFRIMSRLYTMTFINHLQIASFIGCVL